jgi:hypothetical protein
MIPRDAKGGEKAKESVGQNSINFCALYFSLLVYVFRVGTFAHGVYRQAAMISTIDGQYAPLQKISQTELVF